MRDHLAGHLRRVPDGEVGERDTWIAWQFPKLSQCPQLETRSVNSAYLGREVPQHEMVEGARPLELVDLGYADAALASWEQFAAAQDAGALPEHVRFMVGCRRRSAWSPSTWRRSLAASCSTRGPRPWKPSTMESVDYCMVVLANSDTTK